MKTQITTAKQFLELPSIKEKLQSIVSKDTNVEVLKTSILQVINDNEMLKSADPLTVFNTVCLATTLNLPLQKNLGFAHVVPYRNRKTQKIEAQFQMGYKGFIQLALRSGQFNRLVSIPIYQEQLIKKDPINGFIFDFEKEPQSNEKPIGFYSFFRLNNGFTAELYMTVSEVQQHATRYSQTYKKGYGVWADNFEAMALKTVLKLLLSKYAPLSIEMQKAITNDQAVIRDDEEVEYSDNIQNAEYVELSVDNETFQQLKLNVKSGAETLENITANFDLSGEQTAELIKVERGE